MQIFKNSQRLQDFAMMVGKEGNKGLKFFFFKFHKYGMFYVAKYSYRR